MPELNCDLLLYFFLFSLSTLKLTPKSLPVKCSGDERFLCLLFVCFLNLCEPVASLHISGNHLSVFASLCACMCADEPVGACAMRTTSVVMPQ